MPLPAKHCWQHVASLIPPGKGETGPPPAPRPPPGPATLLSPTQRYFYSPTQARPGFKREENGAGGKIPRGIELLPTLGGFLILSPSIPRLPGDGKGKGSSCWPRRWWLDRNSSCEARAVWLSPGQGHRAHGTSRCQARSQPASQAACWPSRPPKIILRVYPPPLLAGGPKGSSTCVLSQGPQRERWHLPSPVSLCPASPLFAWGSSTHDIHGPKAPLRGQSPVPDTDKPLWHHPDAAIPPWSPSFRSEQRAPGTAPAQPQPGHQGVEQNTAEGLKEEQRGRKPV